MFHTPILFAVLGVTLLPLVRSEIEPKAEDEVNRILKEVQGKIEMEMANYNFSVSGVSGLEYLLVQPQRTLIVSSWRTGSTFLGNILNSIPGTFYIYEPLWHLGVVQIKDPPLATTAVSLLKNAFQCNYHDASFKEFFDYHRDTVGVTRYFTHNTRLWEYCKDNMQLCLNPDFMSKYCKLFPIQTAKAVSIRLKAIEDLLKDKRLNLRVVLLIRDPRAMMFSRLQDTFCIRSEACNKPKLVCQDMVEDYSVVERLMHFYPERVYVQRFEELAVFPKEMITDLLEFLKLDKTVEVDRYLDRNTRTSDDDRRSTVRISKDVPFKWKHHMSFNNVNYLQRVCKTAMDLWGYVPAEDPAELLKDSFIPVRANPFAKPHQRELWQRMKSPDPADVNINVF